MEKLGLNEIRRRYLDFFASKEHLMLPSFPLVPENDPSLLLIPAGMAPLKPYFMGELTPPAPRVTTCQKCIRTNDIENVGITARHLTFFEMLGNFSFGDYFKEQAAHWAWEFVTEILHMPKERLYVSIYEEDDEAGDIWRDQVGVAPDHVFKMGKADNFWEIGTGSGPCGPCSEIYFDRGEKYACGPDCHPGCDCDRYVEFWNLVFTQFNNDGGGNYSELAKKNIDTGMGLERIACIMQEVDSLFEVDTMLSITGGVCALCGVEIGASQKTDVSLRIITDHVRSTVMLVCDGVIPSNEGRGYILRRLIRRAARHGRLLGIEGEFLSGLCDTVFAVSGEAYPQIVEKQDYIRRVVSLEEARFAKTIDAGLVRLGDRIAALQAAGEREFSGEEAFRLYDTYGFPVDLTIEILTEQGISLDRAAFDAHMQQQRERARSAREKQGGLGWVEGNRDFGGDVKSEFVGYTDTACDSEILAIAVDGEAADIIGDGMQGVLILDRTPFYAESGGQTADHGVIRTGDALFQVTNVQKTGDGKILHTGVMRQGGFAIGTKVAAEIDLPRRNAIRRAHSSVHLLHAALRQVVGNHVEQAGSLVEPDRARFDFSHFSGLTAEELAQVEALVNGKILEGIAGETREMSIDEAKKMGAIALFGEKYGDTVRVVSFGGFSVELCGGTHLENSAKVGLFHIISEGSVAAGVRRIEAITGPGVLALLAKRESEIEEAAAALKTSPAELSRRAAQVNEELRTQGRELEALAGRIARADAARLLENAREVEGIRLVAAILENQQAAGLRMICDTLRDMDANVAAVLGAIDDGKVIFAACAGSAAVKRGAHGGNLLKAAAQLCGGGGGGRPDSATAGGRQPDKLPQAIAEVEANLRAMLK